MARIRSIKPGFAGDSKVARLSLPARLTFLLLLPEADDEGRMVGSSKRLVGALYPNDEKVGTPQIERWISELRREEMVITYTVDGTKYLAVTNFRKHQNPQHPTPSVLPAPESGSADPPEPLTKASRKNRESITKPSSLSVEGEGEGVELSCSVDSSSSNHHVGLPKSADDDETRIDQTTAQALSLIADQRIATSRVPIANPRAYRCKVLPDVHAEHGAEARRLALDGFLPAVIARTLEPPPDPPKPVPSPYPLAGHQPEPVWDLDDQGQAVRPVSA